MRQLYYLKEEHQEFSEAFSYPKVLFACRIFLKIGKDKEVHPSLFLRYIKYYDEFLHRSEKQDKEEANIAHTQVPFVVKDYSKEDLEEPFLSIYEINMSKKDNDELT